MSTEQTKAIDPTEGGGPLIAFEWGFIDIQPEWIEEKRYAPEPKSDRPFYADFVRDRRRK